MLATKECADRVADTYGVRSSLDEIPYNIRAEVLDDCGNADVISDAAAAAFSEVAQMADQQTAPFVSPACQTKVRERISELCAVGVCD